MNTREEIEKKIRAIQKLEEKRSALGMKIRNLTCDTDALRKGSFVDLLMEERILALENPWSLRLSDLHRWELVTHVEPKGPLASFCSRMGYWSSNTSIPLTETICIRLDGDLMILAAVQMNPDEIYAFCSVHGVQFEPEVLDHWVGTYEDRLERLEALKGFCK